MNFEILKRNNKKKIIIGSMIVLSVIGCITLTTTRAKYRNVQSLKLASGMVKLNQYDFKIVAMKQSEDGTNYTDINTMPETGYIINEEKSYCTTDNKTQVKGKLKTENDKHYFSNLSKNDKCYLWFDKKISQTFDTILTTIKNSSSYKGTTTPNFTQVATGAETEANNGIYETDDPMYGTTAKTYYWRGAATTNHVIYSKYCWRIMRINGDGSIRLIYNGNPSNGKCPGNGISDTNILQGIQYNENADNSSHVGWTYLVESQKPSNNVPQKRGEPATLKTALEEWYGINIIDKSKVATGKFCNDRNTQNNETWRATGSTQFYASYQRINETTSSKPTLQCSNGDIYMLNVGLITADEVQFAGASGVSTNTAYYLYNGKRYWTMTPACWDGSHRFAGIFYVDNAYGNLTWYSAYWTGAGTRPVINLRSDVTFNSGSDGTQNNPYIVQ